MPKKRLHNEWFRTVSLNNRKSCPCCRNKLEPGESIWSWGQYVCAKWQTVKYFCKNCFVEQVKKPLTDHTADCGCEIQIIIKDSPKCDWLTLETPQCKVAA